MMLENAFHFILETSFYGSIIGIIILILKALFRNHLSAKWQYLIWVVLILKLIIPFGPESSISIFNALPHSVVSTGENASGGAVFSDIQIAAEHTDIPQIINNNKSVIDYFQIVAYIWLSGVIILLAWFICTNLLLRYQLYKRGTAASERTVSILESCRAQLKIEKKIDVICQDIIPAPSLFGIFRPKILITPSLEEMSDSQIKYTLLHELSHYRRKDIFANYLLLILRSIHWFNPIIYYCFNRIHRDMEIATDEQTMLYIENTEYKAYGLALIATLEGFGKSIFVPKLPGMANNAKDLEKRIRIISKFKKPRLAWSIVAVLIISTTSVFCLTDAETTDTLPTQEQTVSVFSNADADPDNIAMDKATPCPTPEAHTDNVAIKPTATPAPTPSPTPVLPQNTAESEAAEESYNTINVAYDESVGELDINQVMNISGNKPVASGVASLENFYKTADYNFDTPEAYKFTVYPDVHGNISLYFDSDFPTVVANISISESGANESGTVCMLPTDPQRIYYFYGLDPDKKYDIEISGYCPGGYNIRGKILIY